MKPSYSISKFKDACKQGRTKVLVMQGAQQAARADFSLNTAKKILNFIAYGGLENLKFIRTKLWGNNPEPKVPVMVDSYEFYSGRRYGYIAFMFTEKTKKWVVKSFKNNNELDTRNLAFEDLKKLLH